jgi:hypothetical protein
MQQPLYLIKKKVHGNTYWWNEKYKRWEGLLDNASAMTFTTYDFRWQKLITIANGEQRKQLEYEKL